MPKDGKYTAYVESGDLRVSLPQTARTIEDVIEVLRKVFEVIPPQKLGILTRIKYPNRSDSCYVTTPFILEKLGFSIDLPADLKTH